MKSIKQWITLSLAALIICLPNAAAAKTTLKLGHTGALNHHYHLACLNFKEAVEKRTNGELEIKVFPSDQLGTQRQLVEGAQLGTVDMVLTGDQLAAFVPENYILSLPYLFDDLDHVARTLDAEVGDWFIAKAEKKGFILLAFWENGLRHISNNKRPINHPDDLKGLKIRVPNSQLGVEYFNRLGSAPTPMGFGEVYSALQLGTVDGQENPAAHMVNSHFYEVQKYFSLTGHQRIPEPLLVSKIVFDRLSPEFQKILREEGKRTAKFARNLVAQQEAEQLAFLKEKMIINEVADKEPFRKAGLPQYEAMKKKYGSEVFDMIEAARSK